MRSSVFRALVTLCVCFCSYATLFSEEKKFIFSSKKDATLESYPSSHASANFTNLSYNATGSIFTRVREYISGLRTVPFTAVKSRKTTYIYLGDSRMTNLFEIHANNLHLNTSKRFEDERCMLKQFRYGNAEFCKQSEIALVKGNVELVSKGCWKTSLECFKELSADPKRAGAYLNLRPYRNFYLIINIGLHELAFNNGRQLTIGLGKIFPILTALSLEKVIWVTTFPLLPPAPGHEPKFSRWKQINGRIARVTNVTNALAKRYGISVWDVRSAVGELHPYFSSDTVHLTQTVNKMCSAALLRALERENNDDWKRIRKFQASDAVCGNQFNSSLSQRSTVAFVRGFGDYPADNLYLDQLEMYLRSSFAKNVSVVYLRKPELDVIQTRRNLLTGALDTSVYPRDIDVIIVEVCQENFGTSMTAKLVEWAQIMPATHIVYYCQLSPSNTRTPKAWQEFQGDGLTTFINRHVMKVSSRNQGIMNAIFSDKMHLTEFGGQIMAQQLSTAIFLCARPFFS